jgi:hypothetical protein
MKCIELKKSDSGITWGKVLMAIEGEKSRIEAIEAKLIDEGFTSTQCAEDGDKDGDLAIFYVVNRDEVADFRKAWKTVKAGV